MKAKNFNSYQGTAVAVFETHNRGIVRLMLCDNGMPFVVHTLVDEETKEGVCGHYFTEFNDAFEEFEQMMDDDSVVFFNLDDPRIEAVACSIRKDFRIKDW